MHPIHISFTSKILFVLAGIGVVAGDFSYPPADGIQFRVGDTRTIRFETKWEEYSIALWQQQQDGKSASLGPTLIETRDGAGQKAFEWDVETNNLNLEDSGTFFFWIFQGDMSHQGDQSKASMSSAFFEIKGPDRDGESTRIDPKLILSSSSSIVLVSKTFISEEPSAASIRSNGSSPPASPTPVHEPSAPLGKPATEDSSPSQTTPGAPASSTGGFAANGVGPEPSKSSDRTAISSPGPSQNSDKASSDMSTAAKAGIGVGASIGGLALMAGLAFLIAKPGKIGRTRSVMATSVLFWCRGTPSPRPDEDRRSKMFGRDPDEVVSVYRTN